MRSLVTCWCIVFSLLESKKHKSLFSTAYPLFHAPSQPRSCHTNNVSKERRRHFSTDVLPKADLHTWGYQHVMLSMSSEYSNDQVNDILRGMGLQPVLTKNDTASLNSNNREAREKKREKLPTHDANVLTTLRRIDLKTQLSYSREGHAVLRSFLPPNLLITLRQELDKIVEEESLGAWQQKVAVASRSFEDAQQCKTVEQCRQKLISLGIPAGELPFLQFFNTWRRLGSVEALCKSPLLASTASQLMGIPRVRLYQDSLFVKRYLDGKTPWHIDARMSPFDTQHFITFWIPLQDIPSDGTGLVFVSKSHSDMALPYWNEVDVSEEYTRLEERYGVSDDDSLTTKYYMPTKMGDVTVHSGWTLHCSDANQRTDKSGKARSDRYALAITYVDARAEVREGVFDSINRLNGKQVQGKAVSSSYRGDDEDTSSFLPWIRDVKPRSQFSHDLVPLVWPTQAS